MKQQAIQTKYDADKLSALQKYADKKEVSIETELCDTLTRLYEKLVPAAVREFIEMNEQETQEREPKNKKQAATVLQNNGEKGTVKAVQTLPDPRT